MTCLKKKVEAEGMAQLVKFSLHKRKDLSSTPSTHTCCSPAAEEKHKRSLARSLAHLVSPREKHVFPKPTGTYSRTHFH